MYLSFARTKYVSSFLLPFLLFYNRPDSNPIPQPTSTYSYSIYCQQYCDTNTKALWMSTQLKERLKHTHYWLQLVFVFKGTFASDNCQDNIFHIHSSPRMHKWLIVLQCFGSYDLKLLFSCGRKVWNSSHIYHKIFSFSWGHVP